MTIALMGDGAFTQRFLLSESPLYVSKEGTDVAYTQRFFFLLPFFPLHIPATESSHTLSIGILLTFVMQL